MEVGFLFGEPGVVIRLQRLYRSVRADERAGGKRVQVDRRLAIGLPHEYW
jgi:hypothetical protein